MRWALVFLAGTELVAENGAYRLREAGSPRTLGTWARRIRGFFPRLSLPARAARPCPITATCWPIRRSSPICGRNRSTAPSGPAFRSNSSIACWPRTIHYPCANSPIEFRPSAAHQRAPRGKEGFFERLPRQLAQDGCHQARQEGRHAARERDGLAFDVDATVTLLEAPVGV